MLKTVRCYEIDVWEEMVTYDTDYWEYKSDEKCGTVCYLGKSSQVPKKPEGMLHCAYTFWGYKGTHLDLANFDTTNVIDMNNMFFECESLQSLDLSNFDTSKVTNMWGMFRSCESLQSLDLSSFDTSNVTDMNRMFCDCESLKSLDLSRFDTSKVTNMSCMFCTCKSLQSLDLSSFDTSNVTNMFEMFYACDSLQSLDLSSFDTSHVTDMDGMFSVCKSLQSLDLSSFDTSNVKYMDLMFSSCESLRSLDLSNFDTSNVEGMYYMFSRCKPLKSLDLSSFDTSNVTNMDGIFENTLLSKESTGLELFNKKPKTPNVHNKDSIFIEIDELFHSGNVSSPTSLVKDLKSKGYSDLKIVNAIYLGIESGSLDRNTYTSVIDSYVMKVIVPNITGYFSTSRNVGEVLDILYKKYPEGIVNKAMCMYLRPQYLVD